MITPNPVATRKKLPKAAKIAIWSGGSIVALVVAIIVAAAISIGNQPGGWDAELAKQESQSSAKASQKSADAAEKDKGKAEAAAKASADSKTSAQAQADAEASVKAKSVADLAADKAKADEAAKAAQAKTDADAAAKAKAQTDAQAKVKADADAVANAKKASGQRYFDAWLTSRGASNSAEVLAQSPENVQGYLVSAESPVPGTAVFTAQINKGDFTKAELEKAAMAVLQLVGYDDKTLDRVEIVSADSLVRGVANRRDSPLLNLNK